MNDTRMRTTCLLLATLLVVAACHTGPRLENLRTPWQPAGAYVDVRLERIADDSDRTVAGELLTVSDEGLLLLIYKGSRLLLVPWSRVRNADVADLPGVGWYRLHGETTRARGVEELRRVSRYPQGTSPAVLAELLGITGQSVVDVLPVASEP